MLSYALPFALAFAASLCLTPAVRFLSRRAGVLDTPDGRRRLHAAPVPRLGGVAVFVSFYSCVGLVPRILASPEASEASHLALALFVPSLLILALGIADDLWEVGPWSKIGVQLAAGLLVFYYLGIRIEHLTNPFTGSSTLGALSLPVTLSWIILVTNAFNIVDGMDGLAAGVCFIALSCTFLVSLQMGNTAIASIAAPLAGAVLGFLRYNFNPASIFMGDSGSLFLGFQLAVLSVVGSQKSSTAISVAAPLFILALPLVETTLSTLRRFLSGRSILQPDSGHIHHRLMRLGFTPRRAVGLLYVGSAAFGLASLFIIQSNATVVGLITLLLAAVTWVGIQRLGYSEFAEINSALKRFVNQRRIIQNSIVSRKLADDLRFAQTRDEAWALLRSAAVQLGFSYVELKVRPQGAPGGAYLSDKAYFRQSHPSQQGSGSETSFAVALRGTGGELGQVVFSRAAAAPPLHSELPLLISAVAHGLPRILENRSLPSTHQNVAPASSGDLNCPACGSVNVHRSRSRSRLERIRKNLTPKRLHECEECEWRGWILPQSLEGSNAGLVTVRDPPDLQALDLAIAGIRYGSVTDLPASRRIEFQSPGRPGGAPPWRTERRRLLDS